MKLPNLAFHQCRVGGLLFWPLILLAATAFLVFDAAFAFQVSHRTSSPHYHHCYWRIPSFLTAISDDSSQDDTDDVLEERDWRAFRARLVRQEDHLKSTSSSDTSPPDDQSKDMTQWAYDAGMNIEVGTVLLSIPTTDLCQALEQQYYHRCVVLVTNKNEEGTRGILLNRPTAFSYKSGDDDHEWSLWFGGDMYENHIDDDAEIACLHCLTSRKAKAVSDPIERGMSHTTLVQARELVKDGVATPADFWCFGGHCKWYPGQLEKEMGPERGEWYAASIDATTIWNVLRQQAQAGATSGLDMWKVLVDCIEKQDEALSHIPSGQLRFYDRMLQAWTNTNLVLSGDDVSITNNITSASRQELGPGTLVRATLKAKGFACPPFLLSDQDFHRSIILVVNDTRKGTVGLHLNLPLSGVIQVSEKIILPIRYGGPIGPEEETENDDDSFIWIHRSPENSKVGEGEQLGTSGFWTIDEDDAIEALQSGDASPDDVMVFSGICVWEKDEGLGEFGGGLREQIENFQAMEVVSPDKAKRIWNLLSKQEVLTSETLDSNLEIAISAWEAAGDEDDAVSSHESSPDRGDVLLADAALRAWAAVSLLDEPKTTLIEVPEG